MAKNTVKENREDAKIDDLAMLVGVSENDETPPGGGDNIVRGARATEVNTEGNRKRVARATEVNTEGNRKRAARATEVNTEGNRKSPARATEVNTEGNKRTPSRPTEVNEQENRKTSGRPTEVNAEESKDSNNANGASNHPMAELLQGGFSCHNLAPGEKLQGEEGRVYEIIEKINKESGEAVLYRAKDQTGSMEYAIKVYYREDAIKEEIVEKLKKIDCPYLPKLYEIGKLYQYPYEVMEFYSEGSMEGKKVSLKELKEHLIPAMNTALKVLDENEIVHQDIKPANIMKKGNLYILMDFGISAVRKSGKSYVSKVGGWSKDYLPPWDLAADYATSKWDYYSLGITIYELYAGHLPYAGMDPQERMRMNTKSDSELAAVLKTLDAPDDFKTLLHGLSRSLPYTRWAYSQVQCWLEGKPVIENEMPESAKKLTTGYIFEKVTYHDVDELVQALAKNWEKGKGHLFRGYIRDHLKKNERYDLANISADAEESEDDHDVVFANWLYSMSGSFEKLYWKQKSWTLLELGKEILGKLWECADVYTKDKKKGFEEIVEFLQTDVLTLYCDSQKTVSPEHAEVAERVQRHVKKIRNLKGFERGFFREMYALAYTLTRKPVLLILGMKFEDYPAFMEYIESLYRDVQKEEELKKFLNKLGIKKGQLGDSSSLELQFSCWLNAVRERTEDYRTGKEA